MSSVNTWAAVLLVSWTLQAGAEDASYDKDGLKFSGSGEAVKVFKEAAVAYDEADRLQRQLREQNTPDNDQRAREASSRWYSTREAMYKAALELKITPATATFPDTQGVDMLSTRPDVYALNTFIWQYRDKCADNPARYVEWLKDMLPAWKGCAGEAVILLELGRLHENDPAVALAYYERAAKEASDVDQFQFRRQQAWQGVARMCERLGKYQEALAALKNWEVREPCGTGAEGSRIHRTFWMWRLRRLSGEDPMALRRELVQALKTDCWMISSAERKIIAFYGTDKAALRQDTLAVLKTFEESTEEDKKRHDHDIKVLKAITTLLDEEAVLAAMTDEELIRALQAPKHRIRDDLPPSPMSANVMLHCYMDQCHTELVRKPEATRFWGRAAQEALRRMPALGDKLEAEWRKNKNYAAALVLALHTAHDPPPYLRNGNRSR